MLEFCVGSRPTHSKDAAFYFSGDIAKIRRNNSKPCIQQLLYIEGPEHSGILSSECFGQLRSVECWSFFLLA